MSGWADASTLEADDSAWLMGSLFDDDDDDDNGAGKRNGQRGGDREDTFGSDHITDADLSMFSLFDANVSYTQSRSLERGPRIPPPQAPDETRASLADFAGLMNQGGTCYLNSLLQTLYLLPRFKQGIYALDAENELGCEKSPSANSDSASTSTGQRAQGDIDGDNKENTSSHHQAGVVEDDPKPSKSKQMKRAGLRELQGLFARLDTSLERYVSTVALTQGAFEWGGSQAVMQHDVHELVTKLLERVHAELVGTSQATLVKDTFIGHAKENAVRCVDCGHTSGRETPFMTLFVNVDGFSDLDASLQAQYCGEPERLDGSNAYKCDACGDVTEKELSQTLTRLPPYLFLNLNRFKFNYNTGRRVKISTRFEFPTSLDARKFAPDATLVASSSCQDRDLADGMDQDGGDDDQDENKMSSLDRPDEATNLGDSDDDASRARKSIDESCMNDESDASYALVGIISHAGTGYGGHYMCYLRVDALCPERMDALSHTENGKEGDWHHPAHETQTAGEDEAPPCPPPAAATAAGEWQVVEKPRRKSARRRQEETVKENVDIEDAGENENGDSDGKSEKSVRKKRPKRTSNSSWGTWYKFNDTQVHKVSTGELAQTFSGRSCAYLLVYGRRDAVSAGTNPILSAMVPAFWKAATEQSNRQLRERWERFENLRHLTKFNVHVLGNDAEWKDPFVHLISGRMGLGNADNEVDIDARASVLEARTSLIESSCHEADSSSIKECRVFILSKAREVQSRDEEKEKTDGNSNMGRYALAEISESGPQETLDTFLAGISDPSAHILVCPAGALAAEETPILVGPNGEPAQVYLTLVPSRDSSKLWFAQGRPKEAVMEQMKRHVVHNLPGAAAQSSSLFIAQRSSQSPEAADNGGDDADTKSVVDLGTAVVSLEDLKDREVFYAESAVAVQDELSRRKRVIKLYVANTWPGEEVSSSEAIEVTIDPENEDDKLGDVLARLAAVYSCTSPAEACLITSSSPCRIIEDDAMLFALPQNTSLKFTSIFAAQEEAAAAATAAAADGGTGAGAGAPMLEAGGDTNADGWLPLEPIQAQASVSESIKFTLVRNNDPTSLSLHTTSSLGTTANVQRSKPVTWTVAHSMTLEAMKQDALDALLPTLTMDEENGEGEGEGDAKVESDEWRLRLTNWLGEARDLLAEAKISELPDEEANALLTARVADYISREDVQLGNSDEILKSLRNLGGVCLDQDLDVQTALASPALEQHEAVASLWKSLGPPAECLPLLPNTLQDVLQDVRGADVLLVERGKTPVDGIASLAVYLWNEETGEAELSVPEIRLTEREVQVSLRGAIARGLLTCAAVDGPLAPIRCREMALAVLASNMLLRKLEYSAQLEKSLPTTLIFAKSLPFKLGSKSTPSRVPIPIVLHPSRDYARSKGKKKRVHLWLCEVSPSPEGARTRSIRELVMGPDEETSIPECAAKLIGTSADDLVFARHDAKAHKWEILRKADAQVGGGGNGQDSRPTAKKSKAKTKRDRADANKRKLQHGELIGYVRIADLAPGSIPGSAIFDTCADMLERKLQAEAAEKRKVSTPQDYMSYSYGAEAELRLGGDGDLAFADFS
ncbi:Ubiquitin carboxyl-terminal hydrolase 47 [Hondaea fermentalgiana]|uniref:Ubiquitin carboxyl-terminal hydrolase 47 n=1 Tax=Hondaea fermentalgiana TaxID=2315210 RepID=A0A2R5G679_9STRA|nr:Ubiquitin carboxyl-terminal hydrolase 47 [Hondaea fermentalgiana]|eukprot:GBG23943.1 Ubiquitin carboxyl-terminal hydrolase 47 [Hondaea fermentalgiana]